MSHEIGVEDDVMLEQSAWHKLGKVVGKLFGWAEAIAEDLPITRGVEKVAIGDILTPLPVGDGYGTTLRAQENEYASVRSDGLVIATGLGEQWTPFQAVEGYAFGQAIRDAAGDVQCDLKSLGTLFNGRRWFMTFDLGAFSIGDYKVQDYLSVNGSWDSSWLLQALSSPTVQVCANTVAASWAGGVKHYRFKHTSGIFDRVAEAKVALANHRQNRESFQTLGEALLAKKVSSQDYGRLLDNLFPIDQDTPKRTRTAHELAISQVTDEYTGPRVSERGNGWAFVQAVNTYENWRAPVRVTKGRTESITRALRQVEQLNSGKQPLTQRAVELVGAIA